MSTRIQMLIAAAAAIAIAAAIVVAVVLARSDNDQALPSGDGKAPTPAGQDITWACTVVHEMHEDLIKDDRVITEPTVRRARAAASLLSAAARAGDGGSDLDNKGMDLVKAAYKLDIEQLIDSTAALREPCADVSTEPFESDIAISCEIIDAAPDDLVETAAGDDPFDSPVLWELAAAGDLGLAAAAADSALEHFTTPSTNLIDAASGLDTQALAEAVSSLGTFCADID